MTGPNRAEVRKIAAGGTGSGNSFAVAQLENGTVRAWGDGSSGQPGSGSRGDRAVPDVVNGLQDVDDVAAGGAHALAVGRGRVWAWGDDGDGQLGVLPLRRRQHGAAAGTGDLQRPSGGDGL